MSRSASKRGSQTFEKLSLNVDGMEVDAQDFGTAPAAEDAEQTVHEFTLSFNSAGYVEHGDHIDVDYMNGEHSIQALLKIAGRDEALMSNILLVDFDNDDGYMVDAHLGDNSVLADDGKRWYGGPTNGHIEISAMAVNYSGDETGVITIGLGTGVSKCTAEEADEGDDHGHGHGGGASFEFDCEGEDTRAIMVFEDGNDVTKTVLNDLPDAHIDMEGPKTAPYFRPNPNNREDGWVNATVDFTGEYDASDNKDGWLTFNDAEEEPGVGGYMPVLRYAKDDDIEDAIGAAPLSLTNFPGESDRDAYCGVASAVDALGNESELPDKDDGKCRIAGSPAVVAEDGTETTPATPGSYEALLRALVRANALASTVTTKADSIAIAKDSLANAGILAGVDLTPPGIEIDEDMRINTGNPAMGFDVYDDLHDDHNSGLHSMPLLAAAQFRDTDDTECRDISTASGSEGDVAATSTDCDDPVALASGTSLDFIDPANAYYTVSGRARDKAGNYSAMASHTFVFDDVTATATVPAAPGVARSRRSLPDCLLPERRPVDSGLLCDG